MEQDRRVLLSTYIRLLDNLPPQSPEQEEEIRFMSRVIYNRFVLGRLDAAERELGEEVLNTIDNIIDPRVDPAIAFNPDSINNLRNKLLEYMVSLRDDAGGRKKIYKRQTDNKKSRKKGRKKKGPKTKTKNKKRKSMKKRRS